MYWERFKKKPLKKAEGGIKSQSKRGTFGTSWWSKRWIEALEGFHDGARLARGRTYARKGQVLSIDISPGIVRSRVQGTRSKPYKVEIEVEPLSMEAWKQVIEVLSKQAIYAAKLMAGEMPQDIEELFQNSTYSLFPNDHRQLITDCSCPDWSNPCKHVAAVYYLLGEEFDRDPFLIFRLRGIERETFIKLLEEQSKEEIEDHQEDETLETLPIPNQPQEFWKIEANEDFFIGNITIPETPASLVKSLGKFPFWSGELPLQEKLDSIYQEASLHAQKLLIED